MPENSDSFEAFILCTGQLKREWFESDKKRYLKPYDVDHAGVYSTIKGAGLYSKKVFLDVINCLRHCLDIEVLK